MGDILLIEDEPELADFIVRGLTKEGHSLEHAPRGDSGLQRALKRNYNFLIVDHMQPGLDGLLRVKTLRAEHSAVPVLFLSNLDELDDSVLGLNTGGDGYLPKPFSLSELLARVNAHLRRPALPAE